MKFDLPTNASIFSCTYVYHYLS